MQIAKQCFAAFAFLGSIIPLGGCLNNEVVVLPWSDAKVESLAALDNPWAMAFLPDGRLLITEKPGNLRAYSEGKLSDAIGGVPKSSTTSRGACLMLRSIRTSLTTNLSISPTPRLRPSSRPTRRTRAIPVSANQDLNDVVLKGLAVARGRLDGYQLKNVQVIWRQTPKTIGRGHFGGQLVFGPDGTLFITSGDRQRFDPAQDLGSTLGKIVRINPDGSTPPDNPFVNQTGALPEIWSLGHRNPLGAAFEPASGKLWEHEMGPKGGDEVNIIEKGKNYGWPIVSEGRHYNDVPISQHAEKADFTPPLKFWNPSISPSGLIFYAGDKFKDLKGKALFGGLSSEALIVLTIQDDKVLDDSIVKTGRRIRDVSQTPDGSLLLLTDGDNAELLRLTPSGEKEAG